MSPFSTFTYLLQLVHFVHACSIIVTLLAYFRLLVACLFYLCVFHHHYLCACFHFLVAYMPYSSLFHHCCLAYLLATYLSCSCLLYHHCVVCLLLLTCCMSTLFAHVLPSLHLHVYFHVPTTCGSIHD